MNLRQPFVGIFSMVLFAASQSGCRGVPPQEVQVSAKADFFVSPRGQDSWSGTLPAPKEDGKDGPFATLEAARNAVRRVLKSHASNKPVTVLLRGGTYRLGKPLRLGPADSGTEAAPVTYAAFPGEKPILSGGFEVRGWKRRRGRIWSARIPAGANGPPTFRRLYVNGYRRTLARSPNEGEYFRVLGKPPLLKNPKTGKDIDATKFAFRFREGDIRNWSRLKEIDAFVLRNWETAMLPIKEVDEEKGIVIFSGPMKWELRANLRYFLENSIEFLDAPGEWFFDRQEQELTYFTKRGENMAKLRVVVPELTQLLLIEGKPEEKKYVEHVRFQGLAFRYSDYELEETGHSDWQAAVTVPAAIEADGARYCSFENCELKNIGPYALWFRRGCSHNRVVHCELFDFGAGGLRIGEAGTRANELERTDHTLVHNNFIHDGGSVYYGAIPVWIGQSSDNTVSHNEICDSNYTGISVGWSWGFHPTTCHRNRIEFNHLHHLGRGMLYDMAAIYTLGISTGTVIRNNLIHHIWDWPEGYGAGGIYPDEGSSGLLIENNVVYLTTAGGLTVHYGRDNIVRNNIFALGRDAQIHMGRKDKKSSMTFEHNIVYFREGALFRRESELKADYNVYFDASRKPVRFLKGANLKEWQDQGYDQHSLVADPRFVNPRRFDFRLKPNSPALRLGFKPIDVSQAGLVGEREWVVRPERLHWPLRGIPPKYSAPPVTTNDGFEDTLVGATASLARTHGETKEASIRVTEETAASGKRSLKFTDAPGLDFSWNPHLYYLPGIRKGLVRDGFDLRLGKGAAVSHEWRTSGYPYIVGPSLTIDPEGHLMARDQRIADLPSDEWIHIEILCRLGDRASGTFQLKVRIPGRPAIHLKSLPCDKRFTALGWLGFVSNATDRRIFYLDNVKLDW